MIIAITLHMLAALIWVGGMFFAYMALRPVAATVLEPPLRLTLWAGVFARFFPWVNASIVILLGTGFWMMFGVYGGMAATPKFIHPMMTLGVVMVGIYAYVYTRPFIGLNAAVREQNWSEGAKHLGKIRQLIAVNLSLGLVVAIIAVAGRYI